MPSAKKVATPASTDGHGMDFTVLAPSSAGKLPSRLEGCAYDPSDRVWVPRRALHHVPKDRRFALLRGFSHQVEKARSGASCCKRCGDKIPKDAVRVGYPTKDPRGQYGALVQWLHISCAKNDERLVELVRKGESAMQECLLGYEALAVEERTTFRDALLSTDEPEEQDTALPSVPLARKLERHPAPSALRVSLLPFQAEGLGWLLAREEDTSTRGGILADEMGMGKTLQTIALILASKVDRPTLVVCPAAAMLQWHNEIKRFTEPGSLQVELYYGFERKSIDLPSLRKSVVLTTYQTLEADYRREVNKHKVECEWCGRLFLPEKLAYHQKYFCGPDAERTEKQQKSDKKSAIKDGAAKMLKIGCKETGIVLNPMTALRTTSIKAARRLRQKAGLPPAGTPATATPESSQSLSGNAGVTAPLVLPFPAAVLPKEAQEAMGISGKRWGKVGRARGRGGGRGRTPIDMGATTTEMPLVQPSTDTVNRGVLDVIGRGRKRCRDDGDSPSEAASTPAAKPSQAAALTPSPGAAPEVTRRRWGKRKLRVREKSPCGGEAAPPTSVHPTPSSPSLKAQTPAPERAMGACWGKGLRLNPVVGVDGVAATKRAMGASWGKVLRLNPVEGVRGGTKGAKHKAIVLDGLESGSDSGLELLSEVTNTGASDTCGTTKQGTTIASEIDGGCADSKTTKDVEMMAPEPQSEIDVAGITASGPADLPEDEDEEFGEGAMDLSSSLMFRTLWGRIVLDEAHRIKGRTNSTAQAAFSLRAEAARWCLSGTPLQNRVGELYSIVRFVRFHPYAHYFCSKKGCGCVSLHYRFCPQTSTCRKCGHTKMLHRSHFAQSVTNPIKKFGFIGAGRVAMERLREDVLNRILLRRTKAERQADINLPPLEIRIRRDSLSEEETDFYKSMYMQSQTKFDTYVDRGTLLHNYAHVFDLIMRLRQAVDHPYLIVHGSFRSENGPMPTQSRGDSDVCALCQDDVDDAASRVAAQCGHCFHRDCVSEYLEEAPELPGGGIGCPTCFQPMTLNMDTTIDDEEDAGPAVSSTAIDKPVAKSIMQHIKTTEFKSSTKIEALLQEIQRMMAANAGSKAIVFSQFVRFLELIEWRLKRDGISAAKCSGNMPIVSRNNIVIAFQTDPSLKVLLLSLKAGGEGLNLQAADHIFIMDPWWNPAAELQAIQRAHRIGQTRPVKATRFVGSDTIEERIIELQEKKQSVFDCTVGANNQALQRLTADDIKFLFNQ
eukprot:TRINITY_DN60756_c0_g1_i1.p1 TRINITY_DN60756_c0_g1~~TRINITY_DN60756_c0_g1_i1.p1  ORF type:complete len:1235 (+),score=198.80 TRINITY_DN60756_c0_g1_i1:101-3805(+)